MTMYGLFYYHYDYHEWEELICVSQNGIRLSVQWERETEEEPLAVSEKEHRAFNRKETRHYRIKEVKIV